MKRFLSLFCALIVIPVFGADIAILKTLNIEKDNDLIASKILFSSILRENNWSKESALKKYKVTEENTYADYFDLNQDGVKEIIGYNTSPYFDKKGHSLYILQKNNDKYQIINFALSVNTIRPVLILNDKTNSFYSIRIWTNEDSKQTTIKYDGNSYSIMRK